MTSSESAAARRVRLPRLYAILDIDLVRARHLAPLDICDIWLNAGVRLIQLRAKTLASGAMLELADAMAARARKAGALFIVNDRVDIAALAGAGGVHLGQTDLAPRDARMVIGADRWIGLSTHSAAELAAALDEPVDYVAVGAVFATSSKPAGHPVVGLSFVREAAVAAARVELPLVAIGGITLDTAPHVIESGAASVAVISDLLAGDAARRVRDYLAVLGERP